MSDSESSSQEEFIASLNQQQEENELTMEDRTRSSNQCNLSSPFSEPYTDNSHQVRAPSDKEDDPSNDQDLKNGNISSTIANNDHHNNGDRKRKNRNEAHHNQGSDDSSGDDEGSGEPRPRPHLLEDQKSTPKYTNLSKYYVSGSYDSNPKQSHTTTNNLPIEQSEEHDKKEPNNDNTSSIPSSYYFIDRSKTSDDQPHLPKQQHEDHSSKYEDQSRPSSSHNNSRYSPYNTSRSYQSDSRAHRPSSSRPMVRDPDEGKIFVGGLSWDTTDESLKNYFSKFGRLTDSVVMKTPEGKTRGFAFVTFEDPSLVDTIVAQTHYVDGKRVDPKPAIPREAQHKSEKMFIGGLPWGTTEDELKKYFSSYGTVLSATLMVDQESNQSRGFGFVTFQSASDLQNALSCQPHIIKGQQVETTRALPKTKYAENLSSSSPSSSDLSVTKKSNREIGNRHISSTQAYGSIPFPPQGQYSGGAISGAQQVYPMSYPSHPNAPYPGYPSSRPSGFPQYPPPTGGFQPSSPPSQASSYHPTYGVVGSSQMYPPQQPAPTGTGNYYQGFQQPGYPSGTATPYHPHHPQNSSSNYPPSQTPTFQQTTPQLTSMQQLGQGQTPKPSGYYGVSPGSSTTTAPQPQVHPSGQPSGGYYGIVPGGATLQSPQTPGPSFYSAIPSTYQQRPSGSYPSQQQAQFPTTGTFQSAYGPNSSSTKPPVPMSAPGSYYTKPTA